MLRVLRGSPGRLHNSIFKYILNLFLNIIFSIGVDISCKFCFIKSLSCYYNVVYFEIFYNKSKKPAFVVNYSTFSIFSRECSMICIGTLHKLDKWSKKSGPDQPCTFECLYAYLCKFPSTKYFRIDREGTFTNNLQVIM